MAATTRKRITLVWLLLIGATAISWIMGHGLGYSDPRVASAFIIAIAFVKVRFVMRDFMELRNAPALLRGLGDAWVMVVGVVLISLYWLASDPSVAVRWPHIQGM